MPPLRVFALALVAAFLAGIMVATWGSIGSAVMAMCLITMGAALLYRRFLNRDDPEQWDTL